MYCACEQVTDDEAARQKLQEELDESRAALPPSMRGPHTAIASSPAP